VQTFKHTWQVETAVQHKNQTISIFQINKGYNTYTITGIIIKILTQDRCQGQH